MEEVRAGLPVGRQVLRTAEVIVSKAATKETAVMTDEIVGIDLGTTNSEIAVVPRWPAGGAG